MSEALTRQLKVVIVGHVDHGKSTFIGRLFHDTGSLPEGKLEQLMKASERRGVPFEWANLMDALQSERDQNVTIDTAQIWFRTRQRQYVIIDAPGHKEFLKNMVTGAASADAALLVIDANEGVQEQSRRHGYLLALLGIRQVIVLLNKMDLVRYAEERFREIESEYRAFLRTIGVVPGRFIPVSAKQGDNVASLSPNMPWWREIPVLEALDELVVSDPLDGQPLRLVIQDVYRFDHRRILAGRVESGTLKAGDRLLFSPGQKVSTVKSIERWNAPARDTASAGECIGLTLTEQIFVERGSVASLETTPPYQLTRFRARLFWLGRAPFQSGKVYRIKLATQDVECRLEAINQLIDSSTLAAITRGEVRVERNEVADVILHTHRPIAFDLHAEIAPLGRFVVVDGFEIAGGGIIVPDNYPKRSSDTLHKSHNIFWSQSKVTAAQRALRHGHAGRVVWLTGLSASGKSTIATELERELFNLGQQVFVLDGDNVRHGLCSDLGFSPEDRAENIRRIGEVAHLFAEAGIICITAFISPYRSDRETARRICREGQFLEVYVNAPLDVCEQRDSKGLYAKARSNQIREFTGISAPYEPPLSPEIELRTDQLTVAESVAKIIEHLRALRAR